MIEIIDKSQCTACGACKNVCAKGAISINEDKEGFGYPRVDTSICVDCGLCEKVCPFISQVHKKGPFDAAFPQFYAGQLKDKGELFEVSSGGAAWALALATLSHHGVVYGAAQFNVDTIKHVRAESVEEARKLRRSKYFQSDIGNTYKLVKNDLLNGREVLFCGTGCQIAGLISFLRKPYDKLFTCDVVCHGVPSQKVWRKYREEKERLEKKHIVDLVFRDKSAGWSKNQYKIVYDDGTEETERSNSHLFHSGYLQGLFYRPSCGSCQFARLPRLSDVTLADYWQYRGSFHSLEKDLGVSLIIVNSIKGNQLLMRSQEYLEIEDTSRECALQSCRHLDECPVENPHRKAFLRYCEVKGYFKAAHKFMYPNEIQKLLARIKRVVKRVINII